MKGRRNGWLTLTVLFVLSLQLTASPRQNKNKDPRQHDGTSVTKAQVAVDVFAGRDRDIVRNYFAANAGNLPPGLAKRGGDLPPGLQKQLQKRGHLPPGLDKRIMAFPVDLERQLPPLKPGLVRGVIEGRAVIYNAKTSLILDVFLIF